MQVFEKINFGKIEVKNHFVRSSTWENMTTEDGHMTERLYDVYETLAKNEVGLILTGYANILKEEQPNPGMMGIYDDSFLKEYQKLTDLVHQYDAKIIMQLAYGGTKTTYKVGERVIYAPSAVAERGTGTMGTEMTKEDIAKVEEAFAQAALRVKNSGFDGVEIHGAHTYLINQFLSPYYNRREDEYGGSLENRMRFLVDICEKIRELVGEEFTIGVKLTASEFFEGGQSFEETRVICKKMQEIGMDFIELSGNIHGKAQKMVGETFDGYDLQEEGYFLEYAKIISAELNIPIITVGGFKNLQNIEKIINTTNIAMIGLSRPLLAEPNLIKRWKDGDDQPVKCVRCSKCRTADGNYCVVFKKYKNLIFDMGNVLIQFDPELFLAQKGINDEAEKEILLKTIFHSPDWIRLDTGEWDEEDLEAAVIGQLPKELHSMAEQLIYHWDEPIIPVAGMAELLKKCKKAGYHIYLLSNASHRQHQYWDRVPGNEFFDGTLVSADVNLIKPASEIYCQLLKKYNLLPEESLFIDDMIYNVEAAQKLGIESFQFHDNIKELELILFPKSEND